MYTLYYIIASLLCTCTVHVHFILHKYIRYMYMYRTCTLYITYIHPLHVHVLYMYTLYDISISRICVIIHVPQKGYKQMYN